VAHLSLAPPSAGMLGHVFIFGFIEMLLSQMRSRPRKNFFAILVGLFCWLPCGFILDRITLLGAAVCRRVQNSYQILSQLLCQSVRTLRYAIPTVLKCEVYRKCTILEEDSRLGLTRQFRSYMPRCLQIRSSIALTTLIMLAAVLRHKGKEPSERLLTDNFIRVRLVDVVFRLQQSESARSSEQLMLLFDNLLFRGLATVEFRLE
jgi:hypothetical protein